MVLDSIRYQRGHLEVLDQLRLPFHSVYVAITSVDEAIRAIRVMRVRGAPAIAMVGILSIAVELCKAEFDSTKSLENYVKGALDLLVSARPTAVNIANARRRLVVLLESLQKETEFPAVVTASLCSVIEGIEAIYNEDLETNKLIGEEGATAISSTFPDNRAGVVLTHCNTGSLATSGFGTALGIIRSLHHNGSLEHVYFTETRPVNQGARLTSFELLNDKIPCTMVCDSAVAWLMRKQRINAVIVGADCVAMNGDVANKIGTYGIAITALHHHVPFFVAFPTTTLSMSTPTGDHVKIEMRGGNEMRRISGVMTAPVETPCWNPAFDITPSTLVTGGYVTERGLCRADGLQSLLPLQPEAEGNKPNAEAFPN
ncbi:Methylthioribose-1-phosphate isomerase [Trichuris trichiura]|uniref:Methylthioribose-1-phosphate isomerase n=1 Tax=Trichuris trichiura TaxID=36087 RepID=A0A077ZAX0_TRITR|nr:Methylthioribose-1-phosphate isomerase [Trichuris trichiura]